MAEACLHFCLHLQRHHRGASPSSCLSIPGRGFFAVAVAVGHAVAPPVVSGSRWRLIFARDRQRGEIALMGRQPQGPQARGEGHPPGSVRAKNMVPVAWAGARDGGLRQDLSYHGRKPVFKGNIFCLVVKLPLFYCCSLLF